MRVELLVLIPENESFCTSKKSFVEFLKVDSLISISGQRISYKKSPKSKELTSARFRIETDLVKSKQERYFLFALEATNESQIDEFNELCERIRFVVERISPGKTTINTLWDDIGRTYAEKSYPLINEVENMMRKLIAKFMLINVGVNWSKDTIHPDLFKKIDKFSDPDPHTNDLFKLDFIHLKEVLFGKKRDITLEELDRVLLKTKFSPEDQESIKKYIPRSNWEKYFSSVIDEESSSIDTKWELLYKLRNKVAHNRHVKKAEHEQIRGLCQKLKEIINNASAKLGEIDIDEEDRDLIIYSYNTDSPTAIAYLSEKAVADFYAKAGYDITPMGMRSDSAVDFIASANGDCIGVEVKSVRAEHFLPVMRMIVRRQAQRIAEEFSRNTLSKCHIVIIIRDDDDERFTFERMIRRLSTLGGEIDHRIEFKLGKLTEDNLLPALQDVILTHNL